MFRSRFSPLVDQDRLRAIATVLLACGASYAQAQSSFPSRPIRLVIPYGVGGNTDIVARILQPRVSEQLGQQIVADNRGGGAGIPAMELVSRAAPDGYTVLMPASNFASNPILFRKLPYDAQKDFAAIVLIAIVPTVLVVHPNFPAHSVNDLISLAKSKPGQLNFGSVGNGSGNHLTAEMFSHVAGIRAEHVPYKSAATVMTDLASGRLSFVFATLPAARGFIANGRLRPLAVSSSKRVGTLPDVPTVSEAALRGFEVNSWLGLFVPKRTPRVVIDRLNAVFADALKQPDVRERMAAVGAEPGGGTPEQLDAHLIRELDRWATLAKTVKFEVSP